MDRKNCQKDPRYLVAIALLKKAKTKKQKQTLRSLLRYHAGHDFLEERRSISKEIKSNAVRGKILVHAWSTGDEFQKTKNVKEIPATVTSYLHFARTAKGKTVVINQPAMVIKSTCTSQDYNALAV